MSKLLQLSIQNFRNLDFASLELGPSLNLIVGDNAAGKTSIIEAIWMLSTGRSFRSSKPQNCIQINQPQLTLFTEISQADQNHKLGIQRSQDNLTIKIDGEAIKTQSELAQKLPVQLLTPESHRLLEEGPKARRQYLDWGCFHQNPQFIQYWRQYQRILKQRNQALKQKLPKAQITLWDKALTDTAQQIDQIRQVYLKQLQPYLEEFCQALMPELKVKPDCQYRSGWPKNTPDLLDLLMDHFVKDLQHGHTQYGCHRADIRFKFNGQEATQALSRGQQKLFVCALLLAQASLYEKSSKAPVIMLIDDLPAELDEKHRLTLLKLLDLLNIQHILTSTSASLIPILDPQAACLWEISQGKITPLKPREI